MVHDRLQQLQVVLHKSLIAASITAALIEDACCRKDEEFDQDFIGALAANGYTAHRIADSLDSVMTRFQGPLTPA